MPILMVFLKQYWKQALGAVVILILGSYVLFINHSRASLREKNQLLTLAIKSCQETTAKQADLIGRQNTSIDDLKKKSDFQRKRLEAAQAANAATEEENRKRLLNLSREEVGPTCEESLRYLRRKARELSTW